jgi:hypothetical protein
MIFVNVVKPPQQSRISASATGVRGLMIHLKGTGYLLRQKKKDFRRSIFYSLCEIFLRQEFTGELGFKFDSIALVVNG